MDIALSAIIIFLYLTPGIIFRRQINTASWKISGGVYSSGFASEAIIIALISTLLHALWVWFFRWSGYDLQVHPLLLAAAGTSKVEKVATQGAIEYIINNFELLACYVASLTATAYISGRLIIWLVRKSKIDLITGWKPFGDWYYRLSGDHISFEPSVRQIIGKEDTIITYFATIITHAHQSYLYLGEVDDFLLDDNGGLKSVWLRPAWRRPLKKDREKGQQHLLPMNLGADERYYPLDGDGVFITREEMNTINIEYVRLSPAE